MNRTQALNFQHVASVDYIVVRLINLLSLSHLLSCGLCVELPARSYLGHLYARKATHRSAKQRNATQRIATMSLFHTIHHCLWIKLRFVLILRFDFRHSINGYPPRAFHFNPNTETFHSSRNSSVWVHMADFRWTCLEFSILDVT